MTVRWTVRAADRNRRNDLSAKLTEGLSQRKLTILMETYANLQQSKTFHYTAPFFYWTRQVVGGAQGL